MPSVGMNRGGDGDLNGAQSNEKSDALAAHATVRGGLFR